MQLVYPGSSKSSKFGAVSRFSKQVSIPVTIDGMSAHIVKCSRLWDTMGVSLTGAAVN